MGNGYKRLGMNSSRETRLNEIGTTVIEGVKKGVGVFDGITVSVGETGEGGNVGGTGIGAGTHPLNKPIRSPSERITDNIDFS